MIKDQASFEEALQRVADLLEHPRHGPEEAAEFNRLLHDIEMFQPAAISAPPDTEFARLGREAATLVREAQAFKRRMDERERRERWSTFPEDGQGVGPTTGV